MKNLLLPAIFAVCALYLACSPKTATQTASTPIKPAEHVQFDTIGKPVMGQPEEGEEQEFAMQEAEVKPHSEGNADSLVPYNPSHTFEHDLIHTKIEISFDWDKKRANGTATLTLRPWFYPTNKLTLDAKNFDIHSVTLAGSTDQLKYTYDNAQLVIDLGKTVTRSDEFRVVISYTAKPEERASFGGSAAITSDKGLYFINPDGSDQSKPKQIWTQGETESNSYWFPTVDKPNERCTEEMYITVDNQYKTLSNGILVSSKKNPDGTRTDYWKMDKPHAPYLFMIAVGDYAVVKDKWRGIDVEYYVEPKYEPYARDIFPYTTELLEFFSTKLGYAYAWPKFSQIVVRDYVSGAMENTTAVIFGDFMQKTKRELLDDHFTNEKVVAHEMFHHWFGDLVTTESWANLTLNEGFANYSEYLWLEHKYGRDEADSHEQEEQQGYIFSAAGGGHPLIYFGYKNREDLFDAHSYNKGGAVLHMLRNQVGDDAFFASLQRYLKKNEFTNVEAHKLRMAFEDVTGQDLSWFWNQWYYAAGHPNLEIGYKWDGINKKMTVSIDQNQTGTKVPRVFDLPLAVDIYDAAGNVRRENIHVTTRKSSFTFACADQPALVNVDATKTLLCVKADHHSPEEWAFMYRHAPLYRDRSEALENLESEKTDMAKKVFVEALSDRHRSLRSKALHHIDISDPAVRAIVAKLAETDSDPSVKASAVQKLGETGDKQYIPLLQKGLEPTQAYSVVGAALGALTKLDLPSAVEASKVLQNDESDAITLTLVQLYAKNPDRANLPYFERKMDKMDFMSAFSFFEQYEKMLSGIGDETVIDPAVQRLSTISLNLKTTQWRRFAATKAIADLRSFYKEKGNTPKVEGITTLIKKIREQETDATLKLYYGMF
jgi:aminopeptidase N